MVEDILQKIRKHLERPIEREADVVYLLAEVRKIIYAEKPRPWPLSLWMYCNWAVHTDLGEPDTTRDFLRRVDDYVLSNVQGYNSETQRDFIAEHMMSMDFIYLQGLREELRNLLGRYGIVCALCEDDNQWYRFVQELAGVIEDGTLTTGKTDKLKIVEEVTFTKGKRLPDDHNMPFAMKWDVHLKDGNILTMELSNIPDAPLDKRAYFNGIEFTPAHKSS